MNNTIDLEKILLKHTFDSTIETLKKDTLKAMRDAVEQALKIASENAMIEIEIDNDEDELMIVNVHSDDYLTINVNKQSVLDTIKQVK